MKTAVMDQRAAPRSDWQTVSYLEQDDQVFTILTVDRSLGGVGCAYSGAHAFSINDFMSFVTDTDRRAVRIAWVVNIAPAKQRLGLEFMD